MTLTDELSKTRAGGNTARKTVMLVDDDSTTRELLASILTDEGYAVLVADHGERCLFLSMQRGIDAFVVELNVPGIGGVEVCRRLRSNERYRLTPIIFLASVDQTDRFDDAHEAGADDFVTKPIDALALKLRLRSHIQRMDYFLEMERVRRNLNRYISTRTQSMVESFSATGNLPAPEERDVCVLFSDVRDFTALSQEINPNTLFHMLSHHLGMQVDCVYRHGGYIDKFGGDGIMAIFETPDRATRACRCALEIMDATLGDHARDGQPMFRLGIGINMGPVLIGNIGSADHLDYSAIGGTVNVAARLCGFAEPMNIVVSESVATQASNTSEFGFVDWRQAKVRGIREPITVCTVSDTRGVRAAMQPRFLRDRA